MAVRRHLRLTTLLCSAALALGACSAQTESDVTAASAPPPANGMPLAITEVTPAHSSIDAAASDSKQSDAQRLANLEVEVASLRSDMSMILPALTRLTGMLEAQKQTAATDKELLPPVITVPPVKPQAMVSEPATTQPVKRTKVAEPKMPVAPAPIGTQKKEMPQTVAVTAPAPANTVIPAVTPAVATESTSPTIPTPVTQKVEQVPSLEALAGPTSANPVPPAVVANIPAPVATAPEVPAKALVTMPVSTSRVENVRFGIHSNKTRIVFDLSHPAKFSYDLDNNEHILLVSLPGTQMNDVTEKTLAKIPRIKSYQASPDGQGGTNVVFKLSSSAKVALAQALKASGADKNRIVFDITGL